MALTLVTTLSDPYANSYISSAYCDDFWADHFNQIKAAQWNALTANQKVNLLIEACRVLETARFTQSGHRSGYHLRYDRVSHLVLELNDQSHPVKYDYFQRLQFPRNIDRDKITGVTYIPEPIMMAQAEQTVYLLNVDDTALSNRMQGIESDYINVGNIRLRQTYVSDGSMFSPMALEYIRPYLLKSSAQVQRQ